MNLNLTFRYNYQKLVLFLGLTFMSFEDAIKEGNVNDH